MNNKLLIITGGSQGIGLSAVRKFGQEGWQVLNLSRQHCPEASADQLSIDLSDKKAVKLLGKMLSQKIVKKNRICLVHNAFIYTSDTIQEPNIDYLQSALQIGVVSPMLLNKIIIPMMAEQSSIIYIGSTLATKAVANSATYTTIKHAVVGAMRATCQDLTSLPIHTACVNPGFTDTPMLKKYSKNLETIKILKSKVGANRLILPEEIAEVVYFCAMNPVVNGTVIQANLGQIES